MTAIALPVIQRTPEWLAARKHGIPASEAAAAIGVSAYSSRYSWWARKLDLVPDVEQTPAMLLGELMEPVLAELYERATGEHLRRRNQLLQHSEHRWMLASLDRVRSGRRIVELKHTARGDGYGEPGTDEVPDDTLVQVIHQMAVLDAPEADVAVLVGGRMPIRIYTIHRDPAAEAVVVDREREAWRGVETRTEPPVDGSEATLAALAARYPRDAGEEVTADRDASEALAALLDVRAAMKGHKETDDRLRAVLEAAMGTAAVLVAPGVGRVTWRASKDSTAPDWEAVAADLRIRIDSETWEAAVTAHPKTRKGGRPFLASREKEEAHG